MVSDKIIESCISSIGEYDGVMPSIEVKDTIYQSQNGVTIAKLLKRSELYAGQSPESFILSKYYEIHLRVTDEELSNITGSTVIAIQQGLQVKIIAGDERNFKITTPKDLELFQKIISND